jgi:hypothetical protein
MTTIDTVSLTALWQRWQELEELDDHDDKVHAEFNAIEKQIIDRPADTPPDLLAKLKFLALIARDHDWDDHLEKLYASIEDGLKKSCYAGYRIICDLDGDMSLIENMAQALSIFTLAEDVWNNEPDAAAAQHLIFTIRDSCKNLREAHGKLADLTFPWTREHLKGAAVTPADPIIELMAERERLLSETNASPLAKSTTKEGEAAFHALVCAAGKRFVEIDEQIADTVTTNPESLAAQVELLDLLGGDQFGQSLSSDHSRDCTVRLAASIKRGIRHLSGQKAAEGDAS